MTLPATIGVTGSAGFIGSNLVHRLLDEGSLRRRRRRHVDGQPPQPRRLPRRPAPDAARVRLPRRAAASSRVRRLRRDRAPRGDEDPPLRRGARDAGRSTSTAATSPPTSRCRSTCRSCSPRRPTSTATRTPPFREDDPIVLGPPGSRRWSYAASKYFDEHLALRMVEERGLNCTILRFFNAYGPRNHPTWWGGPLSVFFEDLLDGQADGAPRRRHPGALVHLRRRHRRRVVRALERPETSGEVINIGGDEPIEIVDLADARPGRDGDRGPAAGQDRAARAHRRPLRGRLHPRAVDREGEAPARLRGAGRPRGGPGSRRSPGTACCTRSGPRRASGWRERHPATGDGRRRAGPPAPRLAAVDRRDAALMSAGTLASGVLAYAFNVLAARSLGPESYGAVGALWAGMFLLAVLLFRPLEQTVSRAVADQLARGADARPAVRSAARLTALTTVLASAACLAAWGPITDGLFGGRAGPDRRAHRRPRRLRRLLLRPRDRGRRPLVRRLRPRPARRRRRAGRDRAAADLLRLTHPGCHRHRRGGAGRRGRAVVLARPRAPCAVSSPTSAPTTRSAPRCASPCRRR